MSADEKKLADAAIRLYQKRKLKLEAKKALLDFRIEAGRCSRAANSSVEFAPDCFNTDSPIADWCETCQQSQPLWQARKKAMATAGAALRTVLTIASRLAAKDAEAGA